MNFLKRNWFWLVLIFGGGLLLFLYWKAKQTVAAAETDAGEVAGTVAGGTIGAAISAMPGGALLANIFTSLF